MSNQAIHIARCVRLLRRAPPLVGHVSGQGKVKELLDRSRKRLVERSVERNPGPLDCGLACCGSTGRAVFADKRK